MVRRKRFAVGEARLAVRGSSRKGRKTTERAPVTPATALLGGGGRGGGEEGALSEKDIRAIEKEFPEGLTSVQVVDIFTSRGIRFSEATFRKYVQQGLLPRSRRVGRKGKHQGSMGLYPPTTVRRINSIKQLMAENYTIEDIQQQFLRFRDEVEGLTRSCELLFHGFDEELGKSNLDAQAKRALGRDLADAKKVADDLVGRIEAIERRLGGTRQEGRATSPGGAEDLL
jgi:DNA-binding transcriptional MerR regulator